MLVNVGISQDKFTKKKKKKKKSSLKIKLYYCVTRFVWKVCVFLALFTSYIE